MKEAAVGLLDYFATDLALTTNRTFKREAQVEFKESEYVVEVSVAPSEGAEQKDRRWQVTLEVRHQPGPETNFPYSYRVVLVGQFTVATWAATEEERTVRIHGASVLYGMAREIVRVLTGRGPYRPVLIPTVSFYEQKADPAVEPLADADRQQPKPSRAAKGTAPAGRAKRARE
jgi:preprotein translocase subunit SecB